MRRSLCDYTCASCDLSGREFEGKRTLDDKAALSAHDRWLNPFSGASDGLIKAATGRYICVGGVREAATPAYSQIIYATSL